MVLSTLQLQPAHNPRTQEKGAVGPNSVDAITKPEASAKHRTKTARDTTVMSVLTDSYFCSLTLSTLQ
jgi:hypothetical protein